MQTIHLTVGPDGRVEIPGTQPGQTVTIQIAHTPEAPERRSRETTEGFEGPIPEEEREAIKARVMRRARKIREELPEPWLSSDHGDLLYGDDGLPK